MHSACKITSTGMENVIGEGWSLQEMLKIGDNVSSALVTALQDQRRATSTVGSEANAFACWTVSPVPGLLFAAKEKVSPKVRLCTSHKKISGQRNLQYLIISLSGCLSQCFYRREKTLAKQLGEERVYYSIIALFPHHCPPVREVRDGGRS